MTHLPPFDPFVIYCASHERNKGLRVHGSLLRAKHPLVAVVEKIVVHLDVREQSLILELADDVACAYRQLTLTESDGRAKARD